jgi:hypothetical protein
MSGHGCLVRFQSHLALDLSSPLVIPTEAARSPLITIEAVEQPNTNPGGGGQYSA